MNTDRDRLVCVRYRYGQGRREWIKTVESTADETDLGPVREHTGRGSCGRCVEMKEKVLRKTVKSAGGKWVPKERFWHIRSVDADRLGLEGTN